jgi:hypothetical protein
MRQLTTFRSAPMSDVPDIHRLDGVVAQPIIDAMHAASEHLKSIGVRHMLVGGLAVGAHGCPRATKDVDFVIGPEGFTKSPSGLVFYVDDMPLRIGKIGIDALVPQDGDEYLFELLDHAPISDGVPVAPIEALVVMKLRSPRKKDEADLVEIGKNALLDEKRVMEYLHEHAPDLLGKFNRILNQVDDEIG